MANYKVIFLSDPNSHVLMNSTQLWAFVEAQFPRASNTFHNTIYNHITTKQIPYRNDKVIVIGPKAVTKYKAPKVNTADCPKNDDLNKGADRNHNEWIVFNRNTEKSDSFTNFAALCRVLNIRYSTSYMWVRNHGYAVIGDFVIHRSITPENIYYAEKIKKICKKK